MMTPPRRAVGIIRVSRRAGREGDSFVSPADQERRIKDACERDGLKLLSVAEEIEVSGGKPLEKREHLREAVLAVEAGEAEVVVVAYFDRLVRSLRVQGEVVSRVEAAGGQVLAIDVGAVSEKTASQWLSGTMLGAVAEYHRRSTAERSAEAQADAVARGVPPFPTFPPGLARGEDGRLVHTDDAPAIVKAMELRAGGATIKEVRTFLKEHGIELSYRRVQGLLSSRLLLGELHFGKLVNLEAHEPVVDRDLWRKVQRVSVPRGRRPKVERLLARLGVLRCGSCGARMVIGTVREKRYPFYRCPPTLDCKRRAAISATKVEGVVEAVMRDVLSDVEGRASVEANTRDAERDLERSQATLDAAIRAFADVAEEGAAVSRIGELTAQRDRDQEVVDQLGSAGGTIALSGADWGLLTLGEQRDLVRATIETVLISPGRGTNRISVKLFVEDAPRRSGKDALGIAPGSK